MTDEPEDWREVPQLRSLKRLVSALTWVMILGMITVALALIWRISSEPSGAAAITAEELRLPAGHALTAVGATKEALTVATRSAEGEEFLLTFDPATGAPTGRVRIVRE